MKKIDETDALNYQPWECVAVVGLIPISDTASALYPMAVAAESLEAAARTVEIIIGHRGLPGS